MCIKHVKVCLRDSCHHIESEKLITCDRDCSEKVYGTVTKIHDPVLACLTATYKGVSKQRKLVNIKYKEQYDEPDSFCNCCYQKDKKQKVKCKKIK